MTVADIFKDFRIQARDLVTPNRYRDALALVWYNDGLREIYSRRPEAYEDIVYEDDVIVEATATTDAFPFLDYFKAAMIYHLLKKAAEYDADWNKAQVMAQKFVTELRS